MINRMKFVEALSPSELLVETTNLVRNCAGLEAELLIHLGEVDRRKLYLDCAEPSMFTHCVTNYGFSEDVACNRIAVARAARQFPAILDSVRRGEIHLSGLRLLIPHLTPENHRDVLAKAAGKSKREIEELVACLSPQPPVPTIVRKLSQRTAVIDLQPPPAPLDLSSAPPAPPHAGLQLSSPPPLPSRRPVVAPLSEDTFKIQFTASRAFREKLRKAQDLLRHSVRDGDPAEILERGLDLLIEQVEKDRFAVGRKPRSSPPAASDRPATRHIPASIAREVYERDGGRCTFVDERGQRCSSTAFIQFDHVDGFARSPVHRADRTRLLCAAHNLHAAEKMYGKEFIGRKRVSRTDSFIRPGADSQSELIFDMKQQTGPTPRGP